ncbi:hypothetical protein CANINC_001148 [Pichia inconspicua]|uniref:Mitochondrial inner membrane protease subunit n=1 Tax=Pichia inconspicua TaxID=52247 RepID=A0A4T0X4C1_9ASCO|nr:hypothetical protein CANINC_001148 [[Candida] inconspicua]
MHQTLRDILRIGSLSIRSIAALHLFTSTAYEISQTEGASMLPTLNVNNDFCVVSKKYKNGSGIEMGDIIVARKPTQPDNWVCKRVTGMPGDIILLDPSRGHIDELHHSAQIGELFDQHSQNSLEDRFSELQQNSQKGLDRDPYDMYIIVPEGHVWVTGDNLSDSVDSRTYNVLPMGLIGGKIIIGMYLPNLLGLRGNYYRWLSNTFMEDTQSTES